MTSRAARPPLGPSRIGWQELDFDKRGKSARFSDGEGRDRVIKPMTGDMITAAYPASRAQVRPELAVLCSSLAANSPSTTSTYSAGRLWISASGLGPGLTSDSADAVRAVLRDDLSAGPQV